MPSASKPADARRRAAEVDEQQADDRCGRPLAIVGPRGHEGMAAGSAARSSRSSRPVSAPAAAGSGSAQGARDRATGRRAAALLGRGVVDAARRRRRTARTTAVPTAPSGQPRPAARPRSRGPASRTRARWSRRPPPIASRTSTASTMRRARARPRRLGTHSRCSPDRDDRLGGARVEVVAELERRKRASAVVERGGRLGRQRLLPGPAHRRPAFCPAAELAMSVVEPPHARLRAAWRSSPSASRSGGTTAVVAPSRPRRRRSPGTARAPRRMKAAASAARTSRSRSWPRSARLERTQTRRAASGPSAVSDGDLGDVDRAPGAPLAARRESLCVSARRRGDSGRCRSSRRTAPRRPPRDQLTRRRPVALR